MREEAGVTQGFEIRGEAVRFWVKVKPRARRQRLIRGANTEICFETPAPAVENKANSAMVDYLARCVRVPRSAVQIMIGERSRRKLVEIAGQPVAAICERLEAVLSGRE